MRMAGNATPFLMGETTLKFPFPLGEVWEEV